MACGYGVLTIAWGRDASRREKPNLPTSASLRYLLISNLQETNNEEMAFFE